MTIETKKLKDGDVMDFTKDKQWKREQNLMIPVETEKLYVREGNPSGEPHTREATTEEVAAFQAKTEGAVSVTTSNETFSCDNQFVGLPQAMTGISPSEPMVVAAYAVQPFYPIKPMESPPWGQPLEIPAQPTITYTDSSLRPKVEALIAEIDAKIETLEEVGEGVKVEVTVKTLKWCKEKLLKM